MYSVKRLRAAVLGDGNFRDDAGQMVGFFEVRPSPRHQWKVVVAMAGNLLAALRDLTHSGTE